MASTKLMHTKDGRPFYKIVVSPERGRQYSTRFYPEPQWSEKTTQRQLAKFAADFENKCKNGEVQTRAEKKEKARQEELERAKLKTFRDYALGVYMAAKEQTLSENGRSSYQTYLDKHILPTLGDYLMTEITPAMLNKMLLDFQKQGYKHSTTIKLYNILNGIFDMAFMDYSIQINPMQRVQRPKQPKDEKQVAESDKALTIEQLRHCLDCVSKESLQWQTYIVLCADTGCRRGELCGLQWQDIDFDKESVTINRTLNYTVDAGVYTGLPKNGEIRSIDIGSDTINLLRQLQRQQVNNSILTKWVFTQDGSPEPMHPQSPTGYFKKFGDKYGIENFHPHLLRHTSASIAITNGADVASVSARLGHSDTAITLRMYTHANEDSIRRAGDTVRNLLKKES